MKFEETSEFTKDLKKLSKKYKSLKKDLLTFKKYFSHSQETDKRHTALLTSKEDIYIYKSRFFCRYLKGRQMRVVFCIDKKLNKIIFIELFVKGEKDREDQVRIIDFINNI